MLLYLVCRLRGANHQGLKELKKLNFLIGQNSELRIINAFNYSLWGDFEFNIFALMISG
jgi:hypothetical protein